MHVLFCISAYRNWMNSVGVSPFVNRLYVDLQDGIILFQLYDIIKAGSVDWKRVIKTFSKLKATFEKIGMSKFYRIIPRFCITKEIKKNMLTLLMLFQAI